MQIEISSLRGLPAAIKRCRPGYIISITDPDSADSLEAKSILVKAPCLYARLCFHDIEVPEKGYRFPSREIIASTLVTLDRIDIGEQSLLIQCNAGISRSPAIALLAQCHIRMREEAFRPKDAAALVEDMEQAFGPISPNQAIMDIGASLFGRHGAAMKVAAEDLRTKRNNAIVDVGEIW